MRGKDLLDKMELVDAAYIEAADKKTAVQKQKWRGFAAIAACLALGLIAGVIFFPYEDNLPMLTLSELSFGRGMEAVEVYDIAEMVNNNPWNEDEGKTISKLPVYKNPVSYDQYHIASGVDFDLMREVLLDVAARLGMDTSTLVVTDNAPSEEYKQKVMDINKGNVPEGLFNPTMLQIDTDSVHMFVNAQLNVTVWFHEPVAISDSAKVKFNFQGSYEEQIAIAEQLKSKYKAFLNMKKPTIDISGGDYSTEGEQDYTISFYEGDGGLREKMINYHFNRITFGGNEAGELTAIHVDAANLSEKVGNYPIISAKEAQALLFSGKYSTSVTTHTITNRDTVAKAELVYLYDDAVEYFMPFYRFYVEISNIEGSNLKRYGAYYVPAVEEAYIANMPVWDGSFN